MNKPTEFQKAITQICYTLSEHQIDGVKDGFVTDFAVEEAIDTIQEAARKYLVPSDPDPKHKPFDDDKGCDSNYGCGCGIGGFRDARTWIEEAIG